MLKGEAEVRSAIEKAVYPYKLAGVQLGWGGSHRAAEAILVLGGSRESVFFSKFADKNSLPAILKQVKVALRTIGATHVDMREVRADASDHATAAERLFKRRA